MAYVASIWNVYYLEIIESQIKIWLTCEISKSAHESTDLSKAGKQ